VDNRKKVFELGGRLRIVQDLFEITAIHVHYRWACFFGKKGNIEIKT
jgi:hypothetical protein